MFSRLTLAPLVGFIAARFLGTRRFYSEHLVFTPVCHHLVHWRRRWSRASSCAHPFSTRVSFSCARFLICDDLASVASCLPDPLRTVRAAPLSALVTSLHAPSWLRASQTLYVLTRADIRFSACLSLRSLPAGASLRETPDPQWCPLLYSVPLLCIGSVSALLLAGRVVLLRRFKARRQF